MHLLLAAGLLNPQHLVTSAGHWGGLALVALMAFAESGLLIGFFLPGDSLLFIAGFLASSAGNNVLPPLPLVALVVFVAAVVGDQVGYIFGYKVGPALFRRPDSRLFKQDHVEKAQRFFERHGPKTIVLARFVPVVRTFAPILAGVGRMRYRTFVTYNLLGGFLWAVGLTTAGYFLGQVDWVKNNVEIVIPLIIVISLLPMAVEVLRHRRTARRELASAPLVPPQDTAVRSEPATVESD